MHANFHPDRYTKMTHHRLRVTNPAASLAFYQNRLGMELLETHSGKHRTFYVLGYSGNESAITAPDVTGLLELVHDSRNPELDIRRQPDRTTERTCLPDRA